jgi:5,10-methylenetetrahydromethanopterin reductase
VPARAAIGLMIGTGNVPIGEALALARRADRAGIAALAAGDGVVDNAATMGALAAVTSSARLVTAVAGWTRTPVAAALGALTLQQLSGGRHELGLGPMPRAWSERWHDTEASRPLARMRDYVSAIRAAWAAAPGRPAAHDGPYYRFGGYEHPASAQERAAPPPIALAASRPGMARLAGETADGAIFNLISSPEWIAQRLLPAWAEGRAGRRDGPGRAHLATVAYCAVDDDAERAIALVRPALGSYFAVPYFADVLRFHGFERELAAGTAAAERHDRAAMTAAVSDEMVRAFALVGPVADIRRRLAEYPERLDGMLLSPPIVEASGRTLELSERIVEVAIGLTSGTSAAYDEYVVTQGPQMRQE